MDKVCIVAAERGYFKLKCFDQFVESKQFFVIRIKSNVQTYCCRPLKRSPEEESNITADYIYTMGAVQNRSVKRHRIVEFMDYEGKRIRVVTNL